MIQNTNERQRGVFVMEKNFLSYSEIWAIEKYIVHHHIK